MSFHSDWPFEITADHPEPVERYGRIAQSGPVEAPWAKGSMDVYQTEVRVRFGETDPYGVVYFTSYLEYAKAVAALLGLGGVIASLLSIGKA